MRAFIIRRIVFFGSFLIAIIVSFQIYWLSILQKDQRKTFEQQVHIALIDVAEQVFKYNRITFPNESPVKIVSEGYFIVNVNSVIDAALLEDLLINSFKQYNITKDFEYAIYDCSSEVLVYGNYISMTEPGKNSERTKNLKKLDEFPYYFAVNFPQRGIFYGYRSFLWIISTILFAIATIFIGNALYIILKQKRLASIQKDFIDSMTHEFKTPLASMQLSVERLEKTYKSKPEQVEKYLNLFKAQIHRLSTQLEKVISTAIVDQQFSLSTSQFEILPSIQHCLNHFSSEDKNIIKLESEIEEQTRINADEFHFKNLIFNLIENALKYNKNNAPIRIRLTTKEKTLQLEVIDKGIGMSENELKHLFKKFYRGNNVSGKAVKGYGLGLFYVKEICTAHKWDIKVSSSPEKGSTFIIQIPV
jgi:two-component system, OmpR family, phosphate regulon sensor histidine kinase PhoR